MSESVTELPAAIRKALAQVDEQRARILEMERAARAAEEVLAQFPDLPEPRISIGWEAGSLDGVLFFIGGFGSSAVKDVKIIFPVLKAFSRLGFKRKGEPEDYAEIGRRTWELRDASTTMTPIRLSAFFGLAALGAEGASCRFEQIGVKEAPVYKLVCDGEAPDAEP